MMESLQAAVSPYYFYIKTLHVLAAAIWARDVSLMRWGFLPIKLWIGVVLIVPMEVIDVHLSHLGGNKERSRASGDDERYERVMELHRVFFRVTEPLVIVLIPTMFFLAIVKPF